MKTLAIIPARSGSKRLVHKNIREINGQSLLAHAIDTSIQSGVFSEIVVSSDSKDILESVQHFNKIVYHLRPPSLSGDTAKLKTLVRYLMELYAAEENNFEIVALIIPTSPLRRAEDIRTAAALMRKNYDKINGVMSVVSMNHPPQHTFRIDHRGHIQSMYPEFMDTQSQFLEQTYIHDGTIIFVKTESFLKYEDFYMPNVMPYYINPGRAIDINTEFDLKIAEFLMGGRKSGR